MSLENDDRSFEQEIIELNRLRGDLISRGDIPGLGEILADNYRHVHVTGKVDDKSGTLQAFERSPRLCSSEIVDLKIIGDVAIFVAAQQNSVQRADSVEQTPMSVTGVAQRTERGWKFISFHACRDTH